MPRIKEAFEAMRETTRQKIEAAALSLFSRKGLSVTMDDIAKEAAISKGLIYNHYQTKDALIAELAKQATTISSRSIADVAKGEGMADEKIRSITTMMCRMFVESSVGIDYFMFILQVQVSGYTISATSWYSKKMPDPIDTFARILLQGQKEKSVISGNPQKLSAMYWATIQGLCSYVSTGKIMTPEPYMINRVVLQNESK